MLIVIDEKNICANPIEMNRNEGPTVWVEKDSIKNNIFVLSTASNLGYASTKHKRSVTVGLTSK